MTDGIQQFLAAHRSDFVDMLADSVPMPSVTGLADHEVDVWGCGPIGREPAAPPRRST
jgi:hypothetical protein